MMYGRTDTHSLHVTHNIHPYKYILIHEKKSTLESRGHPETLKL